MRNLFLVAVLALAVPASAEPFRYVSFSELNKASVEKDLAKANSVKAELIASFEPGCSDDCYLKDLSEKGLQNFERMRREFYQALKAVAAADAANASLKTLAAWGRDTWVHDDPSIDLHSSPVITGTQHAALGLK